MCLICLLLSLKIASRRRLVNLACVQNPSPQKKKSGRESLSLFFSQRGGERLYTGQCIHSPSSWT